jgi:hypothetical protein
MRDPKQLETMAVHIARLVAEKNAAYGDSWAKSGEFLKLLYPEHIRPEQYGDALLVVRIFDKLMRVAHSKTAFGESPYLDIAGYGLLGACRETTTEGRVHNARCEDNETTTLDGWAESPVAASATQREEETLS